MKKEPQLTEFKKINEYYKDIFPEDVNLSLHELIQDKIKKQEKEIAMLKQEISANTKIKIINNEE